MKAQGCVENKSVARFGGSHQPYDTATLTISLCSESRIPSAEVKRKGVRSCTLTKTPLTSDGGGARKRDGELQSLSARVERQSHTECLLSRRALGALQFFCYSRGGCFLLCHGLQGADLLRRPGNSFALLSHVISNVKRTGAYSGRCFERKAPRTHDMDGAADHGGRRLSPFSRSGILANLLLEGSTAQEGQNGDMSNL